MKKAEMKVLSFGDSDVIATSGSKLYIKGSVLSSWNSYSGNYTTTGDPDYWINLGDGNYLAFGGQAAYSGNNGNRYYEWIRDDFQGSTHLQMIESTYNTALTAEQAAAKALEGAIIWGDDEGEGMNDSFVELLLKQSGVSTR